MAQIALNTEAHMIAAGKVTARYPAVNSGRANELEGRQRERSALAHTRGRLHFRLTKIKLAHYYPLKTCTMNE